MITPKTLRYLLLTVFLCSGLLPGSISTLTAQERDNLIGNWNLSVESEDGTIPSWLSVRKSGNSTLVGSFVGQFGSARPISEVVFDGEQLTFAIPPQWEDREDDLEFVGTLKDDRLSGKTINDAGKSVRWTGERTPALKRNRVPQWGESISLFNGEDLNGWTTQFTELPNGWIVREGLLVNQEPGNNLLTERSFMDFKLKAEFRYPEGSNGGIYLRGRYEMQIEDNFGDEPESHKIGGIYGYLTPSINAARRPNEWQTVEVTLVGRVVTIVMNGERIVDRQTIPGMTGGALNNEEDTPGPIMLQGDHGPIEFRKLEITLPRE